MLARPMIESEEPGIEQIWVTNQGTDSHLIPGKNRISLRRVSHIMSVE